MANKPTPVRFISKEPVRISFPKFFTKDQLSDSYSCFFLIPQDRQGHLDGGALAEARAEGVWGQEIPNASSTIYDGDKPKAQGGEWPEVQGLHDTEGIQPVPDPGVRREEAHRHPEAAKVAPGAHRLLARYHGQKSPHTGSFHDGEGHGRWR